MSYGYPHRVYYPPAPYGGYGYRSSAPASVHTVAIFIYLGALSVLILTLLMGLLTVGMLSPDIVKHLPGVSANALLAVGAIATGIMFVITCCYFTLGRKLQRGRQWARVLVLLLCSISLLGTAFQVFQKIGGVASATLGIPGLELHTFQEGAVGWFTIALQAAGPLLFFLLLNTRAARSWFSRQTY